MKIAYENWNPTDASWGLIEKAEEIIDEYTREGYQLTLRQLYYQFVSRDLIPNTERSYKNLGNLITKARMGGYLSWLSIEDRNRGHVAPYIQENELDILSGLAGHIEFDRWADQDTYIEVWVEKDALGNVIERACAPLQVPFMACKGYLSASQAWAAGQRFKEQLENGKNCVLLHLGDHDPSGIDMTRDNRERLQLFAEDQWQITVDRIALNMDQVHQYNPPPNPAKLSDSRAKDYIKAYGNSSWELDALEPSVIVQLIRDSVEPYIDRDVWEDTERREEDKKELLRQLAPNWEDVKRLLQRRM